MLVDVKPTVGKNRWFVVPNKLNSATHLVSLAVHEMYLSARYGKVDGHPFDRPVIVRR